MCFSLLTHIPLFVSRSLHTTQLASVHKAETSKDYLQVLSDAEDALDKKQRNRDYFPRLKDPRDPAEIEGFGVPGRIFNHPLTVDLPENSKEYKH